MTTENEDYDGIPDDCLQNAWMIPAYSERLVHAINNEEIEGFQFLPVTVYSYKRQQKFHYYIANCKNIVSALNTGLSSYHIFPDDFPNPEARGKIVLKKIVVNSESINGYEIFRLAEEPPKLIVSEKFTRLFKRNKFTGYAFQAIESV